MRDGRRADRCAAATRREALDALSQDVRDALRGLTKNPGFTVGAALILALGIGFNTTVFSFNKALLFPSLPDRRPAGIARMWSQNMARGIFVQPLSEGDVADLIAASRSFEDVAAYAVEPVTLDRRRETRSGFWRCARPRISSPCCASLRRWAVPFSRGTRRTTPTPVAILSDRAWRNRFGARSAVVGRDILLNGRPHTIVGVMPEDFWFESKEVEVWLPRPLPRAEGSARCHGR